MPPLQSPRIVDQLRERIRYLHYSLRTEEAYVYWVKGYIRFHQLRHPADMGKAKNKSKFKHLLSKTREINVLSAARFFLFGARDIWFVVAVPVFLSVKLGWGFTEVFGMTVTETHQHPTTPVAESNASISPPVRSRSSTPSATAIR